MRRVLFVLLLMVLSAYIFVLNSCYAFASIEEALPLTPVPYDEEAELFQRFSMTNDSYVGKEDAIVSFDFSEQMGLVLLTSEKRLLFMDHNGTVDHALSFDWPGLVGIAWEVEDVCLFCTRGDIILKISPDGTLKGMYTLNHLDYETQKQWESFAFRMKKEVDSGEYILKKDGVLPFIFADKREYTTLVFRDKTTGQEQTLYDASTAETWKTFALLLIGTTLIVMVLLVIKTESHKSRVNRGDG